MAVNWRAPACVRGFVPDEAPVLDRIILSHRRVLRSGQLIRLDRRLHQADMLLLAQWIAHFALRCRAITSEQFATARNFVPNLSPCQM